MLGLLLFTCIIFQIIYQNNCLSNVVEMTELKEGSILVKKIGYGRVAFPVGQHTVHHIVHMNNDDKSCYNEETTKLITRLCDSVSRKKSRRKERAALGALAKILRIASFAKKAKVLSKGARPSSVARAAAFAGGTALLAEGTFFLIDMLLSNDYGEVISDTITAVDSIRIFSLELANRTECDRTMLAERISWELFFYHGLLHPALAAKRIGAVVEEPITSKPLSCHRYSNGSFRITTTESGRLIDDRLSGILFQTAAVGSFSADKEVYSSTQLGYYIRKRDNTTINVERCYPTAGNFHICYLSNDKCDRSSGKDCEQVQVESPSNFSSTDRIGSSVIFATRAQSIIVSDGVTNISMKSPASGLGLIECPYPFIVNITKVIVCMGPSSKVTILENQMDTLNVTGLEMAGDRLKRAQHNLDAINTKWIKDLKAIISNNLTETIVVTIVSILIMVVSLLICKMYFIRKMTSGVFRKNRSRKRREVVPISQDELIPLS